MVDQQPTAAEVARTIADGLEQNALSYAVGGAIALGFYATPRATIDVDVNIFVPPASGMDTVLAALVGMGFAAEREPPELIRQAREEGQFRGTMGNVRVDVFVPAIAYYAELESRRREVVLFGRPLWIVGPDDLAVLKMMFFRRKDLADVEAMARELGGQLDHAFVRAKLVELVGENDPRIEAWEEIVGETGGSGA